MTDLNLARKLFDRQLDQKFNNYSQDRGHAKYAAYINKQQKKHPKLFAEMQAANTKATSDMLDQIQFYGLDEYKGDPRSIRGMEDMEYSSFIPLGAEADPINFGNEGVVAGWTPRVQQMGNNGPNMYFSGIADKGTYRHEAWHRGGKKIPYEEYINRRYDKKYAQENGNQDAINEADAWINQRNVTNGVKYMGDNYMRYDAPSPMGYIQELGASFNRWLQD